LRDSQHVHLKQEPVHDLSSCLGLLDRFLGDGLRYPLEWDDFISWRHHNPGIESVREALADTEALFFSSDPLKRREGFEIVLAERNRIAAIVGLPARDTSAPGGLPPNTSLERTREG
jgi:hypothetical protein